MPDDALYREMNLRVTKLEEMVSKIATVLSESDIFNDPTITERLKRIAALGGLGSVGGGVGAVLAAIGTDAALAASGVIPWVFGGFVTGVGSEGLSQLISDKDNEKQAETIDKLMKDEFFREGTGFSILAELYSPSDRRISPKIGGAEWNYAAQNDWQLLRDSNTGALVQEYIREYGYPISDEISTEQLLDIAPGLVPQYYDLSNPAVVGLIRQQVNTVLSDPDRVAKEAVTSWIDDYNNDPTGIHALGDQDQLANYVAQRATDEDVPQRYLEQKGGLDYFREFFGINSSVPFPGFDISKGLEAIFQNNIVEPTIQEHYLPFEPMPEGVVESAEVSMAEIASGPTTVELKMQLESFAALSSARLENVENGLTSIDSNLASIHWKIGQLMGFRDPFQQPMRMGGVPE
jgi:hypothetical protein